MRVIDEIQDLKDRIKVLETDLDKVVDILYRDVVLLEKLFTLIEMRKTQ